MKSFLSTTKYDYLQRTRSYSFLVTLCISLAMAYTFVPEPNASYSTIRIADHVGYYNAGWFGYVTAIMTSIFLSLAGFYLVNSGIKTDQITKIGQITAATPVSNFRYLFSKVFSNFLVLSTIVVIVFIMSILLFFLYNEESPFILSQFIIPYLLIPIPAMFFIAVLAVVFEVIFKNYSVIQNIGFFFLFSGLMITTATEEIEFSLDPFGTKIVMHHLEQSVRDILQTEKETELNIGYVLGNIKETKKFEFNGITFPTIFIVSRIVWIFLGILLIRLISPFFHRFAIKEKSRIVRSIPKPLQKNNSKQILISSLQKSKPNYGILTLVNTEILMLLRTGKKWLWIINLIGMVLLGIIHIKIAFSIVLPVLWFLQVQRLSEISSKEVFYGVQHFTFTSYMPLRRLLASQIIAGIILMLFLALPLILRLSITLELQSIAHLVLGAVFIVLLAATLGILTNGKKLFEIIFFLITYCNIYKILFADYFGGLSHGSNYTLLLIITIIVLGIIGFVVRRHQLRS
ncbi:hypothetical protein [Aquimarina sp. SS2-1]|uniref:hypothetical protein n=1 Tax=Aquimarina besae TaxID=3342247 RepID=UPI00366B0614